MLLRSHTAVDQRRRGEPTSRSVGSITTDLRRNMWHSAALLIEIRQKLSAKRFRCDSGGRFRRRRWPWKRAL